jgi:hypothetical protein
VNEKFLTIPLRPFAGMFDGLFLRRENPTRPLCTGATHRPTTAGRNNVLISLRHRLSPVPSSFQDKATTPVLHPRFASGELPIRRFLLAAPAQGHALDLPRWIGHLPGHAVG